jgi:hypothetical protein
VIGTGKEDDTTLTEQADSSPDNKNRQVYCIGHSADHANYQNEDEEQACSSFTLALTTIKIIIYLVVLCGCENDLAF